MTKTTALDTEFARFARHLALAAGGVITTCNGGDHVQGDSCVAASRALHAEVLTTLNS